MRCCWLAEIVEIELKLTANETSLKAIESQLKKFVKTSTKQGNRGGGGKGGRKGKRVWKTSFSLDNVPKLPAAEAARGLKTNCDEVRQLLN